MRRSSIWLENSHLVELVELLSERSFPAFKDYQRFCPFLYLSYMYPVQRRGAQSSGLFHFYWKGFVIGSILDFLWPKHDCFGCLQFLRREWHIHKAKRYDVRNQIQKTCYPYMIKKRLAIAHTFVDITYVVFLCCSVSCDLSSQNVLNNEVENPWICNWSYQKPCSVKMRKGIECLHHLA